MPSQDQPRPKTSGSKPRKTNSHGGSGSKQNSSDHRGHTRPEWQETFRLHSSDDSSLKRMIETIGASSAGRHRTCVVSIISRQTLGQTIRDKLVRAVIAPKPGRTAKAKNAPSDISPPPEAESTFENQLSGLVDVNEGLVVLSLESFLEADKLLSLCESDHCQATTIAATAASQDAPSPGGREWAQRSLLLEAWPAWNQNLLKTLLIIFSISNIVIFYSPEPSIDYSLIRLLRLLETQRLKSHGRICDLLASIAFGQAFSQLWIRNARTCCPRALFVCDTRHLDVDLASSQYASVRNDLEDQTFYLLKRNGLLHTLLSIDSEAFVYLLTEDEAQGQQTLDFLGQRHQNQDDEEETEPSSVPPIRPVRPAGATSPAGPSRLGKFIRRNILSVENSANQQSENQNGHKSTTTAGKQPLAGRALILPRFDDFFNVLLQLKCLLFPLSQEATGPDGSSTSAPDWSLPDERRFMCDAYDSSNIDMLFSQQHCQKARTAAYELFTSSLEATNPRMDHDDEQAREDLLESAKGLYLIHARGPACAVNLNLLTESCNRFWLEQTTKPHEDSTGSHTSPLANSLLRQLTVSRKSNGVMRVATSCRCGHETNLIIKPSDRKKKLDRLCIYQVDD